MPIRPIFATLLLVLSLVACKKSVDKQAPLLTTLAPESNGDLSVTASGRLYEQGGDEVTELGFCWAKSGEPTLDDKFVVATLDGAVFTQTISGLDAFTNYNIRAYAKNKYGISYGASELVFSGAPPQPPTINTGALVKLSTTSFALSANLFTPVKQISECGVCWNTTGNPSIQDNFVSTVSFSTTGAASTTYTCNIKDLQPNTIVFAKPYAKNSAGISYGDQIVIRTYYSTFTDHQGNTYFTTLINGKEWMAENLRCTSFPNGQSIPLVSSSSTWYGSNTTPACCLISNSLSTSEGLFYNTTVTSGSINIAPQGWHVPTENEYQDLINSFNSNQNSGYCLIRPIPYLWPISFYPSQLTAFDAKPQGMRNYSGYFSGYTNYSYFSASNNRVLMIYSGGNAYISYAYTGDGYCVRLVKD